MGNLTLSKCLVICKHFNWILIKFQSINMYLIIYKDKFNSGEILILFQCLIRFS